jgi:hypothetical protein
VTKVILAVATVARSRFPRAVATTSRPSTSPTRATGEGANIDEAISKYEQATKLDPDNTRIWWKLALAYEKKEDWQKMSGACVKAEEAAERRTRRRPTPTTTSARATRSTQLADKGDGPWADAKAPFQTAIQLDANYGQAYGELAMVLLHADDEAGAIQNWTKALEAKPDETQYYVLLADEYRRLMMYDQEEQVLREGMSFAKETTSTSSTCTPCSATCTRPRATTRGGHRVRGGEEVVRQQQVQRPQGSLLQPRRILRRAEPARRRTRPSSSCSRSGRSPARGPSPPSSATSARSPRRSSAAWAARSSSAAPAPGRRCHTWHASEKSPAEPSFENRRRSAV